MIKNFNCKRCGQPISVELGPSDVLTGGRQMHCPGCGIMVWVSILPSIGPAYFPNSGHPAIQSAQAASRRNPTSTGVTVQIHDV